MADWHCYKDKVKMVEANVTLRYMQLTQDVKGLKCPKCGASYLTEDVVMTTVRAAEAVLEEK